LDINSIGAHPFSPDLGVAPGEWRFGDQRGPGPSSFSLQKGAGKVRSNFLVRGDQDPDGPGKGHRLPMKALECPPDKGEPPFHIIHTRTIEAGIRTIPSVRQWKSAFQCPMGVYRIKMSNNEERCLPHGADISDKNRRGPGLGYPWSPMSIEPAGANPNTVQGLPVNLKRPEHSLRIRAW
jgi:hypothetical protein